MKRVWSAAVLLAGCNAVRPAPIPPQIRVDTVTVTQVVPPPLPEGRPADLCLSSGVTVQVHISATGDTLIGERRIPIKELRPAVTFPGSYAESAQWYRNGASIRFDRREYRRAGVERVRSCDELKLVGDHHGIPLFAEVTAPQILPLLIVPVRPGMFQDYLRVR